MKYLILSAILMLQVAAQADLALDFKQIDRSSKGPFGLNILQGENNNAAVNSGKTPANFLFQAAYRNDVAQNLAAKYDFYVGNLFTTNYYQLMGEYVYGNASSDHALNHTALISNSAQAMPKAASMTRHWVLEKYYTGRYPQSTLSKSFSIRGVSGSEFEQQYADYYFDFYLSSVTSDFQYLPAFLLAKDSPIGGSNQLDKARLMIGTIYENYHNFLNTSVPMVKRIYAVRNHIHNQLSADVIPEIDQLLKDYPELQRKSGSEFAQIRSLLANYFSFGPDKLVALARSLGLSDIKNRAEKMTNSSPTVADVLALSEEVVQLKTDLTTNKYSFEQKSTGIQLLLNASLLFNKLLITNPSASSPSVVAIVLNTAYIEGFLLKDNWVYFKQELAPLTENNAAVAVLAEMIDVANDTLNQAFAPSLEQWKTVDPKMMNFIDDTLKSSAINTASVVAQRNGKK